MRVSGSILALAMAAALCGQPGRAAEGPAARRERVDAIFKPWDSATAPGCAVAVSRNGVLDYARGYGVADLENAIPITPGSIFGVASVSKQFTAFSVGLLAQEGRLSLDDDIRKYLPEMAADGPRLTIAQLIHHTSGLREQGYLLNLAGWRGGDIYTEADVLRVLSRQRSLNFEPGSEVVYGNSAYTLLAVIVRRVSGQPLRAFAEARIFKPLGMADTRFADDRMEITPRRAAGYSPRAGGGWSEIASSTEHNGSTGVLTTVGDLLKWEQNLVDGRVGGPALVAWMRTSGRLNDGVETGYGGGLHLESYRGLRTVRHDGDGGGYRAEAALFPDQGLAVVALCNRSGIDPTELTRRVAEVHLGEAMAPPAPAPAVETPEAEQAAWAGLYWSAQTDEILRIEWKDGALRPAGGATAFVPIGGGAYRLGETDQDWRFVAGAPAQLHVRDFWPTRRVFHRLAEPAPDIAALTALVGRYRSEETEMTYGVQVADGALRLSWPRQYDLALEPLGGDRFMTSQGLVTFTRNAAGSVDGLTISNRRLRRLRAERVVAAQR